MNESASENERLTGLLRQSVEDFAWAVAQMPVARRSLPPPRHPEDWPVDRHIFHLLVYERHIALPSMRQWSDGAAPLQEADIPDEETMWADPAQTHDVDHLLAELRAVRAEQLALLARTPSAAWDEAREALWGLVTLRWVLTKTYQHTCEHTHDVLRMALWWDTPIPTPTA